MRGPLRASSTRRRAVVLCIFASLAALAATSCAPRRSVTERRPEAPADVLLVAHEHVVLRSAAWTELHAWLARAARDGGALPDPVLEDAARSYAEVLARDPRDEALNDAFARLGGCDDARCAIREMEPTPFGDAFGRALPHFLAEGGRLWTARAAIARSGVEVARAALGPVFFKLEGALAARLGVTGAAKRVVVDIVAEGPSPGHDAAIEGALAARGPCLNPDRRRAKRVHDASIIDCLLVYGAIGRRGPRETMSSVTSTSSATRAGLVEALGASAGERAYTLTVVHASARLTTAWEPKLEPVLRRSAEAAAPEAMRWLAEHGGEAGAGEDPGRFAARVADAIGPSVR